MGPPLPLPVARLVASPPGRVRVWKLLIHCLVPLTRLQKEPSWLDAGPLRKIPEIEPGATLRRPHGGSSTGRHHLSRHYRRPCRMALSGRSVLANGERCGGAILARPAITRPTGRCWSIPPYCMRSSGAEIPPSPVSFVSASRSTARPRSRVIAFGPCKRHSEP